MRFASEAFSQLVKLSIEAHDHFYLDSHGPRGTYHHGRACSACRQRTIGLPISENTTVTTLVIGGRSSLSKEYPSLLFRRVAHLRCTNNYGKALAHLFLHLNIERLVSLDVSSTNFNYSHAALLGSAPCLLTELNLGQTNTVDLMMRPIVRIKTLERLYLHGTHVTLEGLHLVSGLPKLSHLSVPTSATPPWHSTRFSSATALFAKMKTLRWVSLFELPLADYGEMASLTMHAPHLMHINARISIPIFAQLQTVFPGLFHTEHPQMPWCAE